MSGRIRMNLVRLIQFAMAANAFEQKRNQRQMVALRELGVRRTKSPGVTARWPLRKVSGPRTFASAMLSASTPPPAGERLATWSMNGKLDRNTVRVCVPTLPTAHVRSS